MGKLPSWEEFALPVLKVLSDGNVRTLRELRKEVADFTQLDDEQRSQSLPSGQSRADNRIGWAASFLNRVDAINRPSRGSYAITDLGKQLINQHPNGITISDIRALAKEGDEWWENKGSGNSNNSEEFQSGSVDIDPTEQIEQGISRIDEEVSADLLARLVGKEPAFFESAVVELLLAMGYGGAGGRGITTSKTNDEGIDGIIDQDVLGISKVYVQAKRYSQGNTVSRPELQGFVGALSGKAEAGVFITTSRFSPGAAEWARTIPTRIILIDGKRLTELMIEYGVGVQVERNYRVVKIDEDFFT